MKQNRTEHVNLSSYDDVENLSNFSDDSFKKYCDEKLKSCSKHIQFIHKHCIENNSSWSGKICEIGSGNSKLLYRLENDNLLHEGIGLEISSSRYKFAEKFKQYINSKKVTNLNNNVFDTNHLSDFDLVIGVDIVLQLIAPLNKNAEKSILEWIRLCLKPNGFLILELWDFEHILKQIELFENDLRIWEEFPESDPWEFVLADIKTNEENDIIWEKLFLKRDSMERSKFTNILRPYSTHKITSILEKNGFDSVTTFNRWGLDEDAQQGEFVVLAQKI